MLEIEMIEVKVVRGKKMRKQFARFPNQIFKNDPHYVPPFEYDEYNIMNPKKNVSLEDADAECYLAYKDGKLVGRIMGIISWPYNKKNNEKRARISRFDCVDDQDVANALFGAVENWAKEKGIAEMVGPLGYSDLEREGLLIDGFDQLCTFEEQYNYAYYGKLIENCGYAKEVDWTESRIKPDPASIEQMDRVAEKLMERYKLHFGPAKNVNDFINKYADKFFELIDKSYAKLYGTVDFTDGMKKMLIDNFKLIIKLDYVGILLDENEAPVAMGLCFPSIAEALVGTGGHLTPLTLIRLLKAINHPKIIDLGLIGVDPSWANRGVSVVICAMLNHMMLDKKLEYAETNLNLEDNYAINNQWKRFDRFIHKRRRSYLKQL